MRTRNWRLAAIHSLFGYAAPRHPEHAALIQRVLAIPAKRHERTLLTWLTAPEIDALLTAPDRGTWAGRRDHALLVLAVQTGLRVSELIGLSHADVELGAGAHVRCIGKGRKERAVPLTDSPCRTARMAHENRGQADDPVFPSRRDTAQPRCHGPASPPNSPPARQLPVTSRQTRDAARSPPHMRDDFCGERGRRHSYRAMARLRREAQLSYRPPSGQR